MPSGDPPPGMLTALNESVIPAASAWKAIPTKPRNNKQRFLILDDLMRSPSYKCSNISPSQAQQSRTNYESPEFFQPERNGAGLQQSNGTPITSGPLLNKTRPCPVLTCVLPI